MKQNSELHLANQYIRYTNTNLFLTGKAGTGKTTFLRKLKTDLPKRMVVVAPTGVAAINAGGVTIHSFFQLPFGPILPGQILNDSRNDAKASGKASFRKFRREKINIIKSLDLLIIDEISMVRADLLDGIDEVLRKYRYSNQPFGGVQVLMIGDLQQLPPVVKNEEWSLLKQHYNSPFFFSSLAFQKSQHVSIELKHVYRQKDDDFIHILNEVRNNQLSEASYKKLEERYLPDFNPGDKEGYITLSTHNARAEKINEDKIAQLKEKKQSFKATIQGQFPEYSYPTAENLILKKGAQVMFVKNDSSQEKRYFNGKIGNVIDFEDDLIRVQCDGDETEIEVYTEEWQNIKYTINATTKAIEEEEVGSFIQFPLKLAWAITIHKSQGLTFERAIIDANAAFAHGQVYVALSRCKSLEGMVLKSRLSKTGIICESSVSEFTREVEQNPPNEKNFETAKQNYQFQLLQELFSFHEIFRFFRSCDKHLQENAASVLGNLKDKIKDCFPSVRTEILEVGEKFIPQIRQYCFLEEELAQNKTAQDRIQKAVSYFISKLEENVLSILQDYTFDTDNQAIEKTINGYLEQLNEKTIIKLNCLKACSKGFVIGEYLDSRAQAILQKATARKKKAKEISEENIEHPELFNLLRKWRKEISEKNDVPAFYIASQKSMVELANKLPYTSDQLKNIHGMGKKKIERYGKDIMAIVLEYRQKNKLGLLNFTLDEKSEPKKPKIPTREISFDLFKKGKSIAEIATIRDLKDTTIASHLSHYVGLGILPLEDFVDKKKIEKIKAQFKLSGMEALRDVKNTMDDSISFSDLRFVQAFLKNANTK
ncbi:HRDC domain-containing protein [Ancylomarina longa]|uniref:Helicase n=1 Tax=Ancylomarina longa TaxID=2487017 RepID=A0A434AV50_9BACT|nr:HRDC domain-containing protein [Ancylomarina longa]RUT78338.1 helicase [Ancylomarina longa]